MQDPAKKTVDDAVTTERVGFGVCGLAETEPESWVRILFILGLLALYHAVKLFVLLFIMRTLFIIIQQTIYPPSKHYINLSAQTKQIRPYYLFKVFFSLTL